MIITRTINSIFFLLVKKPQTGGGTDCVGVP